LLEKKVELDEFMNSKVKTRLYVTGPPGSGKTSFFRLYCSQYPFDRPIKQQRVLVVQFREASVCDIRVIDGCKIERIASPQLNPHNLYMVL
jgi:Cdc6-like AAA superfamily ATPase